MGLMKRQPKRETISKGEMKLTDSLKVKKCIIMWHKKLNLKETVGRNGQIEKFGTNYGAILSTATLTSKASVVRAVHCTVIRTTSSSRMKQLEKSYCTSTKIWGWLMQTLIVQWLCELLGNSTWNSCSWKTEPHMCQILWNYALSGNEH